MIELFLTIIGYIFALWMILAMFIGCFVEKKFFKAALSFNSVVVIFMAMLKLVTG